MTNRRQLLTLSLIFVAGLLVGAVPGALLGFRKGTNITVDNWVVTNARNGTAVAHALRQLRSNQTGEGLENLEIHLNRLLVGLTPSYVKGFALSEATLSEVQQARDSVRRYRIDYPRPAGQKLLDREVAEFLGTADSTRK